MGRDENRREQVWRMKREKVWGETNGIGGHGSGHGGNLMQSKLPGIYEDRVMLSRTPSNGRY